MKSILFLVTLVGIISASAQFAIDWHSLDGGGGTSTNQNYFLSGTIGQPDAGNTMTGSTYVVQGGFWPGLEIIQTPGAPYLLVNRSGANVLLSWSPATPGFVLQHSATLTAESWQNAPTGATNPVAVPVGMPYRFYRLHKP